MNKVVFWLLVALAGWGAWRMWTISRRRAERARAAREPADTGSAAPGAGHGAPRPDAIQRMVQCAVCGVHLPGSEAKFAGGRVFCSDAHRDLAPAPAPSEGARHDGR